MNDEAAPAPAAPDAPKDAGGWPILIDAAVRYDPPPSKLAPDRTLAALRGRVTKIEHDAKGALLTIATERGVHYARPEYCTVLAGTADAKWSKRLEYARTPVPRRRTKP